MTITVPTISETCKKHNVTPEQFDHATKVLTDNGRKAFYLVESLSTPGQEYRVEWNAEYGCLQCKPHNGEACKASANGIPCWHKRASLAVEEYEKAQQLARRKAEQIEIERSAAYALEIKMHELDVLRAELEAMQAVC